ncbi:flagellar hook-associated protein FlgL [Desulfotalea psychrophila]|uniref:Related to flagellar hook-associated protein 3 (FlgL) n=1 Tax=Desulfotalea psychrophila (strain LSv54 / DSM 12343) TaxID=177439 RepID=Q6AJR1_DESPS|nr:flagellar hook-associated protein FlgL [Desulfotalea psychrophila]CAG37419.1 related to flagellar hook-associated protein 3 (FlgL) [Desulfotalea psychrophila LSv54]
MKVTNSSTYRQLLTNINRNQKSLQNLYLQNSSGIKFNRASDNPAAILPVLSSRSQITLNERFLSTLGSSADQMASTDTSLGAMENVLQRVKEISVNTINASLSQKDLNVFADEVGELKKQMLDTANAQVDGQYIFSGYSVTDAPFVANPDYEDSRYDEGDRSTWPIIYKGDNNRASLEVAEGEYLDISITGNELFSGIENSNWESPNQPGLKGDSLPSSGPVNPGKPGDILIKTGEKESTIPQSFLTDTGDNYAAKLASLLENPPQKLTGLDGLQNYRTGDSYKLDITSAGSTIPIELNGTPGQEFSLAGLQAELGNKLTPPDPNATSGTLANGVQYDLSTGELLLTSETPGTAIELSETVTDDPSPVISGFISTDGSKVEGLDKLSGLNLGDADTYQLEIESGEETVSIYLDGSADKEFTLAGLQTALGKQLSPAVNPPPKTGTLQNGVTYTLDDISGELTFANSSGKAINLSEKVTDQVSPAIKGFGETRKPNSGLNATVVAASADLGSPSGTAYALDITSGGKAVSIGLDGTPGQEVNIANISMALGKQLSPADATATSGTLSNGVSYDTSSGKLVLTGTENGADLDLSTSLNGAPATTKSHYGRVDIATDSNKKVAISGEGLNGAGLKETELKGSVTTDIFGVLTRLEESLRAGNIDDPDGPGGGVQENLGKIDLAAEQNRRKRSQLGVKASRIAQSTDQREGFLIDVKSTLSRYEDADMIKTLNDLMLQSTALEAALSVSGKISKLSILNYL